MKKIINWIKTKLGQETYQLEDFAKELDQVMEQQAQDNPVLRQTHARLDPNWKKVEELALQIKTSHNTAEVIRLTEELVSHGELATRALVKLLRDDQEHKS